uniref:CSON015527 protein n=1 Tax=Culicoides sonorensis TaxID=179676 RepID=A0A336MDG7_CULSO
MKKYNNCFSIPPTIQKTRKNVFPFLSPTFHLSLPNDNVTSPKNCIKRHVNAAFEFSQLRELFKD